jgi:cysteinyl-tRNA synthetase
VGPLRMWYLSAHHRSPLTFDDDRLVDATAAHGRLATFLRSARRAAGDVAADLGAATPHRDAFRAAMDDDLNAPQAVAALHELVSAGNEVLPRAEAGKVEAQAEVAALADALVELADGTLGLELAGWLEEAAARERQLAPLVDQLLDQRQTARAERDFATADRVRDQLARAGVVVEDRPDGPRWYVDGAPAASA